MEAAADRRVYASGLRSARLYILSIHFKQVERTKDRARVFSVTPDEIEDGKAILVADDGLAINDTRPNFRQRLDGLRGQRKAIGEVVSVACSKRTRWPCRCARMRKPSCSDRAASPARPVALGPAAANTDDIEAGFARRGTGAEASFVATITSQISRAAALSRIGSCPCGSAASKEE